MCSHPLSFSKTISTYKILILYKCYNFKVMLAGNVSHKVTFWGREGAVWDGGTEKMLKFISKIIKRGHPKPTSHIRRLSWYF